MIPIQFIRASSSSLLMSNRKFLLKSINQNIHMTSNFLSTSVATSSSLTSTSAETGKSERSNKKKGLPPPITVTSRAVSRMQEIMNGKEDTYVGVKIGVKRRGCNGYSYTMNYATKEDTESDKYELINVPELIVLLDKKAIFFVVGTTMDYEETELSSEFVFKNPNAKGSCGCGESFNV